MMICVNGGTLTDDSFSKLQEYMNDIKGEAGQHAFLVLEVENTDNKAAFEESQKPTIEVKDLASILQKDELFQDYLENNRRRVQSAFRLPDLYTGYTTDFNRATAQTAMEVTEKQVFQPERKSLAWAINNMLFNGYGFKYVEAYFLEPDISNVDDLFKILTIAEKAGGLTPNKARMIVAEALGEQAENYDGEWGDTPLVVQQMQAQQQAQSFGPAVAAQLDAQIEKAEGQNDDAVVAVMKEVRRILKNWPFTSGEEHDIIKDAWDEDAHPRDDNGQFASGAGGTSGKSSGRYDPQKVIGTETSTGVTVSAVSVHAEQRMRERHVSANNIKKALTSQDSKVTDGKTAGTKVYFKDRIRVVMDENTGTIVTCMKRGK